DALVARLHRHIVAIVEQHERPISGTLEYWCVRPDTLREYSARIGRIAECARSLEDVREGVARRAHRERPALPRRDRDVQIARLRGDAVHRTRLPPEAAADDAHLRSIIIGHLGYRGRRDVLVARMRHLER